VLTWAALKIRGRRGWLAVPFFLIAVVASIGAIVGAHPHSWGVATAMLILFIIVRKFDGGPFNSIVDRHHERFAWDPALHSNEDNLRWCWLRAVEWGRWPLFLSQPIAPVLLIWWSWRLVIVGVVIANLIWALFIRYRRVNMSMASSGVYLVAAKWVTWPASTAYLFYHHIFPEAWIAVTWPLLMFPIGALTPTAIGQIQSMFMENLGYRKR
jgi:hypothetical protein